MKLKANILMVHLACLLLFLSSCSSPFELVPPEKEVIHYVVNIYGNSYGTVRAVPDKGVPGTQISLHINPAYGHVLAAKGLIIGGAATENLTFNMPRSNVIVNAVFVSAPSGTKAVHIEEPSNGYISASPQSGPPGTEVELKIRPDAGYGLKAGSLKINGTSIEMFSGYDADKPFTFVLGGEHVTVKAEFESKGDSDLVNSGEWALVAGDFDGAAAYFEAAYTKNKDNPKAIFYSSIGKLLSIVVSTDVRNIMLNRVGHSVFPGNLNTLFSNEWTSLFLENPGAAPEDEVMVRRPSIGMPGNFVIEDLYRKAMQGSSKATLMLYEVECFAQMIYMNPNGWNDLIDESLRYFWGNEFEAAARRAATLPYGQRIPLSEDIIKAVKLDGYMQPGETLGREELDALFGALRMVKGTTEWLGAYDLETDTSFFSFDYTEDLGFFLNETLARLDARMAGQDINLLMKVLPLKNFFLKDRKNGRMTGARKNLTDGANALASAWNYYHQPDSPVSHGLLDKFDEYPWIGEGINQLKTALINKGTFYFPTEKLEAGDNWVAASNAEYGVNMDKVFIPGLLALDKLLITDKDKKSPQIYGFANASAPNGVALTSREEFSPYSYFGFALNADTLNTVFDKGFTQYQDKVWLQDIFSFCVPFLCGKEIYDWYQK
ncbi:MAG TPA: hypothetical protein DEQ14_09845 [Treponema sp.]|nr:hypothetical protein [Treponema sp.]